VTSSVTITQIQYRHALAIVTSPLVWTLAQTEVVGALREGFIPVIATVVDSVTRRQKIDTAIVKMTMKLVNATVALL